MRFKVNVHSLIDIMTILDVLTCPLLTYAKIILNYFLVLSILGCKMYTSDNKSDIYCKDCYYGCVLHLYRIIILDCLVPS